MDDGSQGDEFMITLIETVIFYIEKYGVLYVIGALTAAVLINFFQT